MTVERLIKKQSVCQEYYFGSFTISLCFPQKRQQQNPVIIRNIKGFFHTVMVKSVHRMGIKSGRCFCRGLSHFLQQGIGHIFSGSKKFTDLRRVITSLKSMIFSFLLGGYIIIYCNDIFFLSAVFFSLNALYVRKK